MRIFIALLAALALAGVAFAQPITPNVNEKDLEVVLHLDDAATVGALKHLQLTITGRDGADFRLRASADEVAYLEQAGYKVEVLGSAAVKAAGYRTYAEVAAELQQIVTDNATLAKRFTIGESANGKMLYALKISDNVGDDEAEPALLYDFTIHGDEAIGTEVAFGFIYELLDNYGSDPAMTALVDNNEIWLIPVMNPDGYTAFRGNGNGVDMNRDYPFWWEGFGAWTPQPEIAATMDLAAAIRPVFSVSYHGGAELVNYTWDSIFTRSPEDDLERYMSHVYQGATTYSVTNGADWYIADGTTEDWYHGALGTLSVIVEISYNKMPPAAQIPGYVNMNLPSMIDWAQESENLVRGVVTDAGTDLPLEALVIADGRLPITSDPVLGDYYRLLPAGQDTLHVWANGFGWNDVSVTVPASGGTVIDIALEPQSGNFAAIRTVLNFRKDTGDNPANVSMATQALGGQDGLAFSLGVNGYAVFEFGENTPVVDQDGADLMVFELGNDEGYTVLVAQDWTGPWVGLGAATGNGEFDLADSPYDEIRYVMIRDDGDGANSGATPGADIDAIEAFPACAAPDVDFNASPTSGAAPLTVDFQSLVNAGPGCLDSVSWDFGDGGTSAENDPEHTYTAPGVYTVSLTAIGPGGEDTLIEQNLISVDDDSDDDSDDDTAPTDDDDSASAADDDDDDDDGGCGC
jgi:Zinc carboxypeptidase/PKD domain